jgi:hypothetical protein
MKTAILSAVALVTVFAPMAAFAATYEYVNTSGTLETETATNPTQALTQPTDIAPNSGVILVTGNSSVPMIPAGGTTTTTTVVTPAMSSSDMTSSSTDMMMSSSTDMTASSSDMMMSSSTTMNP